MLYFRPGLLLSLSLCLRLLSAQAVTPPSNFLPHALGQTFTPHHLLVDYFQRVADESPRVQLEQYGTTNEDRPLLLAYVSTPENLAQLEEIRLNNLRRAGLLEGDTDPTLNDIAIVWLSFSVHGNEAAGAEASMGVLYDLADPDNAQTSQWLENTVVLIDPALNPDGYNRYTNWYRQYATAHRDADIATREHQEPWPGGRTNHYLFDLNRDWAWQTQKESRHRLIKYRQWMPHIHADLHEQGYTSPYYFAPAAAPFHEYITDFQAGFQTEIGENHARYFDRNGWLYFTRERFDLLYPSYGDTYPTFSGAIGMTYEQGGSSRGGRAVELPTGDTLTLYDRVAHHRTTALSTVEIAAREAERLTEQFAKYFEVARTDPQGEYVTYVIAGDNPRGKLQALIQLLNRNDIRYGRSRSRRSARMYDYRQGREVSASVDEGDIIISAYQPRSVLTQVLFDPITVVEDSVTYDITAWSVPLAYGLEAYASTERIDVDTAGYREEAYRNPLANMRETEPYAYAIPWNGMSSARFLAALARAGVQVRTATRPFGFNNQEYPAGTLVVNRGDNRLQTDLLATMRHLAEEHHAEVEVLRSGFSDRPGGDLGSGNFELIGQPKVATISGDEVYSNSFGQLWYYFEQELDYPLHIFHREDMDDILSDDYDVLIFVDGRYRFSDSEREELKDWIRGGGKLITVGAANRALAGTDGFGLAEKEGEEQADSAAAKLASYGERERRFIEEYIPGAIVEVEMDATHPLSFGIGDRYFSLKTSTDAYDYLDAWNVGRVRARPRVQGFVGNRAYDRLEETLQFGVEPLGRGQVIYMVDNPLFRAFWENGKLLVANAVFQVR